MRLSSCLSAQNVTFLEEPSSRLPLTCSHTLVLIQSLTYLMSSQSTPLLSTAPSLVKNPRTPLTWSPYGHCDPTRVYSARGSQSVSLIIRFHSQETYDPLFLIFLRIKPLTSKKGRKAGQTFVCLSSPVLSSGHKGFLWVLLSAPNPAATGPRAVHL